MESLEKESAEKKGIDNLQKIEKQGKQELATILPESEEINSETLDFNSFEILWKRKNGIFQLNKNLIKSDWEENYIIIDGLKYYENQNHEHCYKQISDVYDIPCFYIWELDENWEPSGDAIVLRCDGWFFRGEWGKKWTLKDDSWTYSWNFYEGKPIDRYTRPSFQRKWEYQKPDGTKETYIAYPSSVWMIRFIRAKDEKPQEKRGNKRGSVVSVDVEMPTWVVEHKLYSWKREMMYSEDEANYIFEAENGIILKLPKQYTDDPLIDEESARASMKWADRARYFAHLVNAIGDFISQHPKSKFSASWDDLKVKYSDQLLKRTLLRDIPDKLGIQAKEFANWLNNYSF